MSEKPRQMDNAHRPKTGNTDFDRWFAVWTAGSTVPLVWQWQDVFIAAFEAGQLASFPTASISYGVRSELNPDAHNLPGIVGLMPCPFAIPTHHCALAAGHETPHQMVQTVQIAGPARP